MRKKDWKQRSSTERRYYRALIDVIKFTRLATKGLETPQEIIDAVLGITELPSYQSWAKAVARSMVKSVLVENAQSWREAAKQGQNGPAIHQLLKSEFSQSRHFDEIVDTNTQLIKSIPSDIAKRATKKAAEGALAGKRSGDIAKAILQDVPGLTQWKASLIARTETAKAQAAITEVRAKRLNLPWYVWRTSEDQRVRSSHKHMDGVLCQFLNPPDPEKLAGLKSQFGHYNPGNVPNCRCYAEPLIDIAYIDFRGKVCTGTQIQRMSLAQFRKLI